MIQKEVQELIDRIARKYNKPTYVIEEIFLSEWRFLKEHMSEANIQDDGFKTVKLPKWGKYYLLERKVEWLKRNNPEGAKSYYGRKDKKGGTDQADNNTAA